MQTGLLSQTQISTIINRNFPLVLGNIWQHLATSGNIWL
ncbi:MAG: hypothetical protein UX88_C0028G0016 [Candidatus Woesebacteria bacterium GW2011_GWC2_47_16]|uniref:Uncharacterized protein n=1 Tax=Candidatus Woesebacteria bacterium GW2011_GWC2_47_16 TaxID=1618590 RepID=A0A0G1V0N9_9BACT|nr:MAG: hypothetical protein UX88_C0028G0016 [Candidatus Woesebacteria bacterium GW2011_GWC2_47_16]